MALPPGSPARGAVAVDGGTLPHRTMKIHWTPRTAVSRVASLASRAREEDEEQGQGRGHRLHDEDARRDGARAEESRDHDADQEEDLDGDRELRGRGEEPPDEARGQEAVVEALVRGQGSGGPGLLLRLAEGPESDRPRPEEHLEHEEPEMLRGDEAHQRVCRRGHGSGAPGPLTTMGSASPNTRLTSRSSLVSTGVWPWAWAWAWPSTSAWPWV